jgi:cytochrome o ubiquinol oxidase operon protein cyoD
MSAEPNLEQIKKEWHGTLTAYIKGFLGSLFLTVIAFYIVVYRFLPEQSLIYAIVGLALAQAIVQLFFFLHLGEEAKPRWHSLIFYFMVLVVFIIAFGTLWIITDLNHRVMAHMTKEKSHD